MKIQAECITTDVMAQYVQGRLAAPDAEHLEDHVHECSSCFAALAERAAADGFFQAALSPAGRTRESNVSDDSPDALKLRLKALSGAATNPPTEDTPVASSPGPLGASARSESTRTYAGLAGAERGHIAAFRLVDELGRGGMGIVYRAEDPQLGRQVAVKVMLPRLAVDEHARARFLREAKSAAAIEHENVVPIYHVGEDDGAPYFVMPLLRGQSLADRLRAGPPLSLAEVLHIGRQMALGLAAAHARGLVHRDIKPANLFLVSGGVVSGGVVSGESSGATAANSPLTTQHSPLTSLKILDFGLARLEEVPMDSGDALTRPGAVLGTPEYMSPEQARGEPIDFRSDLYSAGVVLYRLTAGKLPFAATTAGSFMIAHATETPRDVRELTSAVPPLLAETIMQLLEKDPAHRPPSAQALAETLGGLLQSPAASVPSPAAPAVGSAETRRHAQQRRPQRVRFRLSLGCISITVALTLSVCVVTGGGVFLLNRDQGMPRPPDDGPATANLPVRVKSLQVLHYARVPGGVAEPAVVGEKSFESSFDDAVTVTVELAGPAYAFLLAFNADGSEQLLWPVDGELKPSDAVAPPRVTRIRYPARPGKKFFLDDDPGGGVQVFVAVVASEPLPAYAQWKKARGPAAWQKRPAAHGVWSSDGAAVYPVRAGQTVRGHERDLPGAPPLVELCRSLQRGAQISAVEALAFPVRAKE